MKILDKRRPDMPVPSHGKIDGGLQPTAVPDIDKWVLYERAEDNLYCVGSIERDRFIAVPESKVDLILDIVALFDGKHSIEWIQSYYLQERGQQVDVAAVYRLLSAANLISDPKPVSVFQGEFKRFSVDLVSLTTGEFFHKLQPFARRILKPFVLISLMVIVLGLGSFRPEYLTDLLVVDNSYTLGFLVMFFSGVALTIFHEFAHAFTAAAHGASTRQIRLALYMGLLPTFYAEIAGMYTLKPKDRIKVWAAGPYSNLFLGSLILLSYPALRSYFPITGQIMLKVALGSFLAVVGNLSPLLPTDGYFIMSTLMKQVNIRTNTFQEFFKWLRREKNRLKGMLLLYFLATGSLILGALALQIQWAIKIVQEIAQGSLRFQIVPSQLLVIILVLLLVGRIILHAAIKIRRKWTYNF